ncbi:hypothetical protein, variant [Gaeumannomyces tritici R3-111a-1]|nr:hypothetical protein, variant [Gaeumannomyces tritici R3-111a-1]EJT72542.1 hypothetical protein, variant [Gaeumannomyces tritici R3-111a-1]
MSPKHMYQDGQPRNSWLKHQKDKMERSEFPRQLRRPKGALNWVRLRVAEKTGWTHHEFLPQLADLCEVHRKGLNPWLIHDVFKLVHDESTLRTTRIRGHKSDLCTPEVQEFLNRMAGINSLWLEDRKFNQIFGRDPPVPERFRFQKLGNAVTNSRGGDDTDSSASTDKYEEDTRRLSCEACVLACVGGHPKLLTALRASLLGRTKSDDPSKAPILILLIDAWIEYGKAEHHKAVIEAESDKLGRALRAVRVAEGKVQKEIRDRRARRRHAEEKTSGEKERRDRDGKRLSRHSNHHHSSRNNNNNNRSPDRHRDRRDRPASQRSARPATVDPSRLGAHVAASPPPRARSHVLDPMRRRVTDPVPPMQALRRGGSIKTYADLQARTAAQHRAMVERGEWDERDEFASFKSSESVDDEHRRSNFSELGYNDDHYTEIGVQMKQREKRASGCPRAPSSVYSQDSDSTARGSSTVRASSSSSSSRPGGASFSASSTLTVRAPRVAPATARRERRDPETVGGRRERAVTEWYGLMSEAGGNRRDDVNDDGVSALDATEDSPGYAEMLVDDVSSCDDDGDDDDDDNGEGGSSSSNPFRDARSAARREDRGKKKGKQPQQQQQQTRGGGGGNDDAASWVSMSIHSDDDDDDSGGYGPGPSRWDSSRAAAASSSSGGGHNNNSNNSGNRPHSMYTDQARPPSRSASSRTAPPYHATAASILDYYFNVKPEPEPAEGEAPPVFGDPFASGGRRPRNPPSTAVAPSDVAGGRRSREGGGGGEPSRHRRR